VGNAGIATGAGSTGTWAMCGTAGEMGGSLNCIKCVGDLLTIMRSEIIGAQVAIKTSAYFLRVLAAGASTKILGTGINADSAATATWDFTISVPIGLLEDITRYTGIMAFYFGVFLPSLPYTLFIIVVVGWVLAVVQTVIAMSLWAIMHMTPDRSFIGSQTQGYLLLLSLFARPALATLGLFAALLVNDTINDFVATGFFSMRGAIVVSAGFEGVIASFMSMVWWFIVYGMTLLPVMYMVFGLPQMLPDHVLRVIGAGVGDLGETNAIGNMRSGVTSEAHSATRPGGGSILKFGYQEGKPFSNITSSGGESPSGDKRGNEAMTNPQGLKPLAHDNGYDSKSKSNDGAEKDVDLGGTASSSPNPVAPEANSPSPVASQTAGSRGGRHEPVAANLASGDSSSSPGASEVIGPSSPAPSSSSIDAPDASLAGDAAVPDAPASSVMPSGAPKGSGAGTE
jgi:hypothetical protein